MSKSKGTMLIQILVSTLPPNFRMKWFDPEILLRTALEAAGKFLSEIKRTALGPLALFLLFLALPTYL